MPTRANRDTNSYGMKVGNGAQAPHTEIEDRICLNIPDKSGAICKIHAKYSARAARSLAMQIRKSLAPFILLLNPLAAVQVIN